MRDMAHSICLIKLYQITMRKNFDFLFLTTLNNTVFCVSVISTLLRFIILGCSINVGCCSDPCWLTLEHGTKIISFTSLHALVCVSSTFCSSYLVCLGFRNSNCVLLFCFLILSISNLTSRRQICKLLDFLYLQNFAEFWIGLSGHYCYSSLVFSLYFDNNGHVEEDKITGDDRYLYISLSFSIVSIQLLIDMLLRK